MLRLVRKYTFIEAELDGGYKSTDPLLDRRQKFSAMSTIGVTQVKTFLSALKKEETLTFKKKVDWRMRRAPEPQKKKWRDHNSRLNALVEDFDIDTEPLDYLFCLGELLSSV